MKCIKDVAGSPVGTVTTVLDEVVRAGAQKMLKAALEEEVEDFLEAYKGMRTEHGKRAVTRNGRHAVRRLLSGVGPIEIAQPRVDDRGLREAADKPVFVSALLPKYLRRMPSLDNLIPAMYLKGISTSDFPRVLSSILGDQVKGLSPSVIVRLKEQWERDYNTWAGCDLSKKQYVYLWADGIYFNVRLEDERSCILVLMGADEAGNKELIGLIDGVRESTLSWKDLLLSLKRRGLSIRPKLAIGDGALGFWNALDEVFPQTRQQRCWVHKTANILDKVPKRMQAKVKASIHEMYMAATKEDALAAYRQFVDVYGDKYPKATECLVKDKDQLFTFYDFPAAHWVHIRTTNPIESTFATVRHRTRRTKGCGSRVATLTMAFKLVLEAQRTWKKLRGYQMISHVINDVPFVNGIMQEAA